MGHPSQKGRKKKTNGVRRGRRWVRESIRHRIGEAWSMLHGDGEFRKEGQLALLAGRFRWRKTVESSYQQFGICEEKERMTFKM